MARKRSTEARRRQRQRKRERERIAKRKEHLGAWAANSRRKKLLRLSERQNHRCCYCGVSTWHPMVDDGIPNHKKNKRHIATLEHIKTRSEGGTFAWNNLVMACSECNNTRGTMTVEEFLEAISKPPTKPIASKEKKLSPEAIEKQNIKMGRLFKLLVIAAWAFPEDYARLIEDEHSAMRGVLAGQRKPKKRGRQHTLHNIRKRIHNTNSPEAMASEL